MKNLHAYVGLLGPSSIPAISRKVIIFCIFLQFFSPNTALSQSEEAFEEIPVILNVQRIGSLEIPAIIHNQEIYLPVKDIFDFLKINNQLTADLESISGFFINPQATFLIDKSSSSILYENKRTNLEKTDLYRTEYNLYLKSDYFGSVFGLLCNFNFRNLTVTITTKIELPAIREMQLDLLRKNISRLKGEKKVDLVIDRKFSFFKLGMADWMVINNVLQKGKPNTTVTLALGATIAGGEANVFLNYNTNQPFNKKLQNYNWRFVNNNYSLVKQVTVGKIFPQSAATLLAPVTGIQITNTPTTYRRSFGTYTLSNTTEPGWMVELYINNVLVNYMKADASGFYTFEVPMVYGNSEVKLRFYGPWGEERTTEKYINIPFNFIPVNQLEYSVTGGIVGDDDKSLFTKANINYGLGRHITVGGGMEYLSSLSSGKLIPYVNASVKLGPNLLLSGEHIYGVKSAGVVSFRKPSSLFVDFNYTKYDIGQTAVRNNFLEEKKLVIALPVKSKKYSLYSRLTLNQITQIKSNFTSGELLLSGTFKGISTNFTTFTIITDKAPLVYSNLSTNLKLPFGFRITPMVQYEYRNKNISVIRAEIGKSILNKGFLNITYEKNLLTNTQSLGINLRYNFSFAQTFLSVIQSSNNFSMTKSARGSLIYDQFNKYPVTDAQSNVGRGGILVLPFLDLNANGVKDKNEPNAYGLKIQINGGRVEYNKKDTTIRITGLEAYNSYFMELDKNSFENINWDIKHKNIKIVVDPNQLKLIEIPVQVMGEVSGMVYKQDSDKQKGQGRIIVNIYNEKNNPVAKILSESDGYFSFMGLTPGNYIAAIDESQLEKLNMNCLPKFKTFTIKVNPEGDIVDNLQFILTNRTEENVLKQEKK